MRVLSIPELQLLIRPHVGRFSRVVWPIWTRYLEIPENHRLAFDAKTEANILHRYMVEGAKTEFDGTPGIQFIDNFGFYIGVDGMAHGLPEMAVCRLKKLDDEGHSRNFPTDRAEALRQNKNGDRHLKGLPEQATYVDIGYVLNDLRTGIREVQAIRVLDTQMIFSIPRSEDGTISMNLPMFPVTPAPTRFIVLPGRSHQSDGKK